MDAVLTIDLYGDGDDFVEAHAPDSFWGNTTMSRDFYFHVPGNGDGQTACKARLNHHGMSIAQADEEASDWSDELCALLYAIVEDLHGRRQFSKRWERVGEAVTRLPAEVRAAHLGYATVAFEVMEGNRSKLVTEHRRALYLLGI